jgi:hypothetical protein
MKLIKYLLFFLVPVFIFGCAKDEEFNNTDTKVGHSRVVFFPTIETIGERLIIINQGDTYTEAGATAKLAGETVEYQTSGTVNPAVPGIYNIAFEASNPEGFSASDFRTVVVLGNDVGANDFSGTYARYVGGTPNGQTSTWTKIANGVYTVVNPGGATGVTATAVNYTGNRIAVPPQITEAGLFSTEISATSGIYYPNAIPPKYEWVIINATYGTALRTFIKQ